MEWDDLRFVLEVSRTGAALSAARAIGVNQTTVIRRIARLEKRLGAQLFERRPSGYAATELGRQVSAVAARIEAEVEGLSSELAARRRAVSGSVKLSAAESLANMLLAPLLQSFHKAYPEVRVELDASDRRVDVARGEADVALRAGSRPEGGGIVARRLPDNDWAVYCSRAYAEEHGCPAGPLDMAGHAILALDGRMAQVPAARWLRALVDEGSIRFRSNSLTNMVSNIRAGLGVGALPCIIGDAEADLVRCFPPPAELRSEMWLVVRAEVKSAPHVRALAEFLADFVISQRAKLAPGDATPD